MKGKIRISGRLLFRQNCSGTPLVAFDATPEDKNRFMMQKPKKLIKDLKYCFFGKENIRSHLLNETKLTPKRFATSRCFKPSSVRFFRRNCPKFVGSL
jgi:hypothetical protein